MAVFASHIRGCNLSSPQEPVCEREMFHQDPTNPRIYVWSHAPIEGTRFFPTIRYRTMPCFVESWSRDSAEPLVLCRIMPSRLPHAGNLAGQLGYTCQQLRDKGWQNEHDEGYTKYLHVDELEKIEGPLPEKW